MEGLSLTNFNNDAIVVQGPGSDLIEGNFVGVGPSGTGNGSGNQVGVFITLGSSRNTIGGTAVNRNVISGNNQQGLLLENGGIRQQDCQQLYRYRCNRG